MARVANLLEGGIEVGVRFDGEFRPLAEAPFQRPYGYCPGIAGAGQVDYVLRSLALAQEKGALTYVLRSGNELEALLQFEQLPWDSEILGFPVGRTTWWLSREPGNAHREEVLRRCVQEAEERGLRYLLARVPSKDLAGAHILHTNGFELIDGLLTFGVSVARVSAGVTQGQGNVRCEIWVPDDLPALRRIAASSFVFDRFHNDPAISQAKADEVHRRWLENSCSGSADAVLVARDDEPVGFTILKLDPLAESACGFGIGTIALVATSAQHRRKGIARSLTVAALDWFRKAGCSWVEVGTQLANIPASRVYQSAGFGLVGSSLTFRRLL